MKKMLILFIILFRFLFRPPMLTTFYKWVDEKGIVNYTDDYDRIPPAYRNRVEIEYVHEESPLPPVQKMTPQKREEAKTDIYGLGEAYWRGKVRPWKEFLKTAEANYEKAHQKIYGKS